jgi:nucleoid-associated protein YgaU
LEGVPVENFVEEEEEVKEAIEEDTPKGIVEEGIMQEEEDVVAEEENVVPEENAATAEEIISKELEAAGLTPEPIDDERAKPSPPYLLIAVILVLLLCGGAIYYMYHPDLFSPQSATSSFDMPTASSRIPDPLPSVGVVDTVAHAQPSDSVTAPHDSILLSTEIAKKEIKAPQVVEIATKVLSPPKTEPTSAVNQPYTVDSTSCVIVGTKTQYTIKAGDMLTRIALHFYGTKAYWPYIVKHNPTTIKNPNNVPLGTVIKIPELVKR